MNPMVALLSLACVLVVVVPVALWIGGVILRGAVGLTNRVVGGAIPDFDYYDEPVGYRRHRHDPSDLAIPVPSSGKAMGIVFLIGAVDFAIKIAMMVAGGGRADEGTAALITLPVSLIVHTAMLSSLLPTTLGRAVVVLLFQFLIVALIVAVVVAVVVALSVGLAGSQ